MRKHAFVERIAARTELPVAAVQAVLAGVRAELITALAAGDVITCDRFGRFKIARQTRTAPGGMTEASGTCVYICFRTAAGLKRDLAAACAKIEANRRRRQAAADRRAAGAVPATDDAR